MGIGFREFLKKLSEHGELLDISRPVDLRDVAALVPQSDKGLLFSNVSGYRMPLVSGIFLSRNRLAIGLETPYEKAEEKLRRAMEHPIEPVVVREALVKEIVVVGDHVDLYQLPVPIFSLLDGAPTITGAVVIAQDPEYGLNAGIYRLMLKERNLTGIDIVTPNNLRRFAERALAVGKPLPVSISIGVHPYELLASSFKAPLGINELTYAGGLRGEPSLLTPGETIPVPSIADAEIVLEGEILPEGWTHPEGPVGEFNRLMGGLHYNPRVRIQAMMHRRDPIYYALHMPWENIWLSAPVYEAAAWRVLREAGVSATAIHLTPGGCCHWHIIAAIKKQPGDGKNAILALLSIADIKHVVVTDDDIDIFDPVDVEWAIATRVQADRDVVIVSSARAKPLDPSLPPSEAVPTTAKMGIDATIPEYALKERYQRIVYFNEGKVQLKDYLDPVSGKKAIGQRDLQEDLAPLAEKILAELSNSHRFFAEILTLFPGEEFRKIARAIGWLHQKEKITQDKEGKYQPKGLHPG